jgi:hypothetical protein
MLADSISGSGDLEELNSILRSLSVSDDVDAILTSYLNLAESCMWLRDYDSAHTTLGIGLDALRKADSLAAYGLARYLPRAAMIRFRIGEKDSAGDFRLAYRSALRCPFPLKDSALENVALAACDYMTVYKETRLFKLVQRALEMIADGVLRDEAYGLAARKLALKDERTPNRVDNIELATSLSSRIREASEKYFTNTTIAIALHASGRKEEALKILKGIRQKIAMKAGLQWSLAYNHLFRAYAQMGIDEEADRVYADMLQRFRSNYDAVLPIVRGIGEGSITKISNKEGGMLEEMIVEMRSILTLIVLTSELTGKLGHAEPVARLVPSIPDLSEQFRILASLAEMYASRSHGAMRPIVEILKQICEDIEDKEEAYPKLVLTLVRCYMDSHDQSLLSEAKNSLQIMYERTNDSFLVEDTALKCAKVMATTLKDRAWGVQFFY